MENFKNSQENQEVLILKAIEKLAELEEMQLEDILADMMTFSELSETDEAAEAYFEDLSEQLGIPVGELLVYARQLRNSQDS